MDFQHQGSSLTDELANVIVTLHGLFDEIGLSRYDRDSREASVYAALNAALQEQVHSVATEKDSLAEECRSIISSVKQMEHSLNDDENNKFDDLRLSMPLLKCLQGLKEKHKNVKKRHAERYDAIKKLVHALSKYASHLESSAIQIPLPPITDDSASLASFDLSLSYYERLEEEFNRVYQEFNHRVSIVDSLARDIINLYAELGIPNSQIDRQIVEYGNYEPERLGLRKEDMENLRGKKERLLNEKEERKARVEEIKAEIEVLWEKLYVEETDRKRFLAQHRGADMKCIQEFENELERLLKLKHEHLHIFVADARQVLQDLWDKLYFSDDEILDFSPALTDVYTDALLSAHEMEISRLQNLLAEHAPILEMIEKHQSLINDREQLVISSTDASRLTQRSGNRDPTRLLREEKMRKRIAKELPRLEIELKKALEKWEEDEGRPFSVKGESYLETLVKSSPVLQSRVGTRTPVPVPATNNTIRGRPAAKSISDSSHQRAKSRAENTAPRAPSRPPNRPKTPSGPLCRPKTPSGPLCRPKTPSGQPCRPKTPTASTQVVSTISKSGGRSLGQSFMRSEGAGRIPQPLSSKTPTRLRAPLSIFPNGNNSPERKDPGGNASVKRNTVPNMGSLSLGETPNLQQPQRGQTPARAYLQQQYERERMQRARSEASIRSVSPPERSYSDEEQDHQEIEATPRQKHSYPPQHNSAYIWSHHRRTSQEPSERTPRSSTADTDSASSRRFSGASESTLATTSAGSENWETFGEEPEEEENPRDAYYRQRYGSTGPEAEERAPPPPSYKGYVQGGKQSLGSARGSVTLVRDDSEDGWTNEDY